MILYFCFAGRLLIADTNNSLIRSLDLNKKDPELLTLELKGVQPPAPKPKSLKRLRRRSLADTQIIKVDGTSSSEGDLYLRMSLPDGFHFSKVVLYLTHAHACPYPYMLPIFKKICNTYTLYTFFCVK